MEQHGQYGENLFVVTVPPANYYYETRDAINVWIDEVTLYNYNNPGFSGETGHFTQAVWKATTEIGCAWNTVPCDEGALLFCEYQVPGNAGDAEQYRENVLPYVKNP